MIQKITFRLLLLSLFSLTACISLTAQTLTNVDTEITKPEGSNTRYLTIQASGFDGNWYDNYTWSISPTSGVSLNTSGFFNSTAEVEFTALSSGTYTLTCYRGDDTLRKVFNIHTSDFWYALGAQNNSETGVYAMRLNDGTKYSSPTKLIDVNAEFAALGRGPYPTAPAGYFYYLHNVTNGNDGKFTLYGENGDGSGATATIVSNFDINGSANDDVGFVRLGLQEDGTSWILAESDGDLILVKIPTKDLSPKTPVIVDNSVQLAGAGTSTTTFQNGDLCLDANGNIYVLANSGALTEIYIGQINGSNTTLEKKWEVLNANGDPFTGSVNGCAFDEYGGMYLSTTGNSNSNLDGIYYLEPNTITSAASLASYSTVNAIQVHQQTGITDLGTNIWPGSTPLPLTYGDIRVKQANQSLAILEWDVYDEEQVLQYEIEMSHDAQEFVHVGTKEASNSFGKTTYQQSININPNVNKLYFRVKSIEEEINSIYSKIVVLNLNELESNGLVFYPNPTINEAYFNLNSTKEYTAYYSIISETGRIIYTGLLEINKGVNKFDITEATRKLPKGNYILKINNESIKFIKN